ncbi:hypothetical protein [Streptomyces sp. 8N616]|uniref:hypothetical protein n=1 Tax=Streptomyces sp. 8N616 TaxID=3457414 RepID=UPI003FCF4DA8
MSTTESSGPEQAVTWHELILRLSGHVPDELVCQVRAWLAEGRVDTVARTVLFGVLQHRVLLTELEAEHLSDLLTALGIDSSPLDGLDVADFEPSPPFAFGPEGPEDADGREGAEANSAGEAAVTAARAETGAIGLWRAWRYPHDGAPWPPPRPVYLFEVRSRTDLPGTARRMQDALAAAGEPHPQVEVYPTGTELPLYQRMVRGYGSLVWASAPEPEITVAAVFDRVDERDGPSFEPGHALLEDEPERNRILAYLDSGELLLVTTALMDDVVDPPRGAVVPMSFRTDGTWIWTDTTTYYLREHLLEPDRGLLAHIRELGYRMPDVDGVAAHRALAVLQQPTDEEPVWSYGGPDPDPDPEPVPVPAPGPDRASGDDRAHD